MNLMSIASLHAERSLACGAGETPSTQERPRTIHGVEIFDVGTHNGDKYCEADIDDMIAAFSALDFRPALKIGHVADKPGAPAWGYVANLRKAGTKLVADLTDIPAQLYDWIRDKRFSRVSSEIYFNLKRGSRLFRRALKAVALLGSEVPAVAGLRPLDETVAAQPGQYASIDRVESAFAERAESAAEQFDRLIWEEVARAQISYSAAWSVVAARHPDLRAAYEAEQAARAREPWHVRGKGEFSQGGAGEEVVRRAKQRLRDGLSRDYAEAEQAVLDADERLKGRYFEESRT